MNVKIELPVFLLLTIFLYGCDNRDSSWHDTSNGAVRINAFDYIASKIDIEEAYNQDGVCKDYHNDLNVSGALNAVDKYSAFKERDYYYYHNVVVMNMYKDDRLGFRLTISESKKYLKLPRVQVDLDKVADKFENVNMASKMKLAKNLKDDNGSPKRLTAKEIAVILEDAVGKQKFDAEEWVVANFFDKKEQRFLECVADVKKLQENEFTEQEEASVRADLDKAEKTMREIINSSKGSHLF